MAAMTTPSQAAQAQAAQAPAPTASVNGQAPGAAPAGECEDCLTGAEKGLAVFVACIGAAIILMAADYAMKGKLSAAVGLGPRGGDGDNAGTGS
jgi:hypothetical protein